MNLFRAEGLPPLGLPAYRPDSAFRSHTQARALGRDDIGRIPHFEVIRKSARSGGTISAGFRISKLYASARARESLFYLGKVLFACRRDPILASDYYLCGQDGPCAGARGKSTKMTKMTTTAANKVATKIGVCVPPTFSC